MRHERDEKLFPDLIVKPDHQNAKDILSWFWNVDLNIEYKTGTKPDNTFQLNPQSEVAQTKS